MNNFKQNNLIFFEYEKNLTRKKFWNLLVNGQLNEKKTLTKILENVWTKSSLDTGKICTLWNAKFEKHFNSFRKYPYCIWQCTARILRNLRMWIYNSHPILHLIFLNLLKKKGTNFDIWNLSNEFGYGIWKKLVFESWRGVLNLAML